MNRNIPKRIVMLSSILLMSALPSAISAQTGNNNPLPKLLSVRQQQAVRETWLKKRLETMLLPMMRQQKIDMWIVTNEEFHERAFLKRRKESDFPRREAMGVSSRLDILRFLPLGLSSYSTESATLDDQTGQPAN